MFSWISSLNFSNPVWQATVFWLWGFVALGGGLAVVGSFSSAVIQYYISDATERKANIEIINSKTAAFLTQEKAAEARKVSDIAQQNIATLNAYIAELRLPRTLTEDQIVAASSVLEQFAGTNLTFAFTDGDKEITDLMGNIDYLLTRSKWNLIEWKGIGNRGKRPERSQEAGIIITNNVEVRAHSSRWFLYRTAVEALASMLTANGITAVPLQWNGFDPNEDAIQIIVGKKLPPPPPRLASLPPMTSTP